MRGASGSRKIVQSNMGWASNTPVGTGSWYGLYTIGIYHLAWTLDTIFRAEWFDDVEGTRTGLDTNYGAVTLGLNWHPWNDIEIRPEVRGDFAEVPAFGEAADPRNRSQFTTAITGAAQVLMRESLYLPDRGRRDPQPRDFSGMENQ